MKGVDSNIIVYAINKDLPEHIYCKELLKRVANGDEIIAIPSIVFMESFHALVHVYKFPIKKVKIRLSALIDSKYVNVLDINVGSIVIAFEITESYGTGGRDSLIAASLLENSINTIYSHDKDFDNITKLERLDPIN
ncbi:MAG: type II toxin-antitoxin system VapC family toxin [Promethearchaeota archaeon]